MPKHRVPRVKASTLGGNTPAPAATTKASPPATKASPKAPAKSKSAPVPAKRSKRKPVEEIPEEQEEEDFLENDAPDLEDSDDEENEDEPYQTFEDKAAAYREQMLQQQAMEAEQTAAEDRSRIQRPGEVVFQETMEDTNIEDVRQRVTEIVRVLTNFSDERDEGHDRTEYLQILMKDLGRLYDYNEFLLTKLFDMLPPEEVVELIEANEKDRPLTLRVNTLKTKRRDLAQALAARGMHVQALEKWSNVGLQVFDSKVAVGATLEYLAGHYMIQSAVSFLPVIALDPQPNENILDLAAAPGGKTTYIAQLMKNTGVLFANDVSAARSKALYANVQRMGCNRVVMTCMDGRKYSKMYRNFFDRVLLDAPCSGTGVISRDKSIKATKTQDDILVCTRMQKEMLLSAIDSCKIGGTIVYSTCSILVEENERVADYALRRRGVKIVDSGLLFGRPGFEKIRQYRLHPDVTLTRRYFPHLHNMDGFYVCKFVKVEDKKFTREREDVKVAEDESKAKRRKKQK
eukprot:PhF_6_TR13025/c0_g1_i1/m.20657/K14835/NOP2; 25S rRNA (cytosine2870-C5)-methyltransferase